MLIDNVAAKFPEEEGIYILRNIMAGWPEKGGSVLFKFGVKIKKEGIRHWWLEDKDICWAYSKYVLIDPLVILLYKLSLYLAVELAILIHLLYYYFLPA